MWPRGDLPGRTVFFCESGKRYCPRGQHRRRDRVAVSAVKGIAASGHHSPVFVQIWSVPLPSRCLRPAVAPKSIRYSHAPG